MFWAIGLAVPSGLGRRYTHPGRWVHLPFRDHWPYWFRSINSSCSRTNDWQLYTNFRRRTPTFIPYGNKASLCGKHRKSLRKRWPTVTLCPKHKKNPSKGKIGQGKDPKRRKPIMHGTISVMLQTMSCESVRILHPRIFKTKLANASVRTRTVLYTFH